MPKSKLMRIAKILNHSFAPDLLGEGSMVLDCGANEGGFSAWISQHTLATVHAFEPDPRMFARLQRNPLPRVTYHELAVDGWSGEFDLALAQNDHQASSAIYTVNPSHQNTVPVQKVSLDDFCRSQAITRIDLLKLDIEGAELNALEQTSATLLQSTAQITVEFHDFINPADLPRIKKVFKRLKSLGFHGIRFSHHTWGDCLFINQRLIPLSALEKAGIQLWDRWMPGIVRKLNRLLGNASG